MQVLIAELQKLQDTDVLLGDSISEKYQHDWSADAPEYVIDGVAVIATRAEVAP